MVNPEASILDAQALVSKYGGVKGGGEPHNFMEGEEPHNLVERTLSYLCLVTYLTIYLTACLPPHRPFFLAPSLSSSPPPSLNPPPSMHRRW